MIDLYYAPTPNGWKISIMLEECNLPYNVIPVNLGKGDQFKPDFLKISPNNRMPAIVDHENLTDGDPLSIFESGAILMYLGEKTGKFFPQESPSKEKVLEWLFWQVGGLGPMAGQVSHFVNYAPNFPGDHSYSEKRYKDEYDRLLGVMDNVLEDKEYLDILKFNLVNLNDENFDFIFYIAGVDVHYEDRLGKLKLTDKGIKLRDNIVIDNFFSKRFTNFLRETNLYTYISYKYPTVTWPTYLPNFVGIQIDHVLFSKNFNVVNKMVAEHIGSDHRPLVVDLVF